LAAAGISAPDHRRRQTSISLTSAISANLPLGGPGSPSLFPGNTSLKTQTSFLDTCPDPAKPAELQANTTLPSQNREQISGFSL
jgi:hypothetical protein